MSLAPDEVILRGRWLTEDNSVAGDETCRRIDRLVTSELTRLGADPSGWDTLYHDPKDGRLWELVYEQSELQGGGPPTLQVISSPEARAKYGLEPLSETELEAICSRIDQVTVRLMDLDDDTGGGSAVAVKVGEHGLLLTAAHVVNNGHRFRILSKISTPAVKDLRLLAVDEAHDTAIMELASAEHGKMPGFARLSDLVGDFQQAEAQPIIVTGFPGSDHFCLGDKTFLTGRACQTETVVPDEWPASLGELDIPPTSDSDVILRYDPDVWAHMVDDSSRPLSAKQHIQAGPPQGMSGGGIWVISSGTTKGGVWIPLLRLAALQSTFVKARNLLRGTLIVHALRLLAREYPEAKGEIQKAMDREQTGTATY